MKVSVLFLHHMAFYISCGDGALLAYDPFARTLRMLAEENKRVRWDNHLSTA